MTLSSMTGFARAQGAQAEWRWHWEIRSVNARGLDVRVRFPDGFDGLESAARILAAERFARGNISASLTLTSDPVRGAIKINADILSQVISALEMLKGKVAAAPPTLDGILALRGVLEVQTAEFSEVELAARDAAVLGSLANAFDALGVARREEGSRLHSVLAQQIDRMEQLVQTAERLAAVQPAQFRTRLRAMVDELLSTRAGVSEERLAQEVALLLAKADVREEIDRLRAHIAQARDLFAASGAQGRRLDFLAQEFNREANTLCSKSSDMELTRIGLELKTVIDQMREQVQNVE